MQCSWKIRIVSVIFVLQALYSPSQCQSGDGPVGEGSIITDTDEEPYEINGKLPSDFVTEKSVDIDDWYIDENAEVEDENENEVQIAVGKNFKSVNHNLTIIIDYGTAEADDASDDAGTGTTTTNVVITSRHGDGFIGTVGVGVSTVKSTGASISSSTRSTTTTTTTGTTITGATGTETSETGEQGVKSSKGTIILVILATIVLIGTCCAWRFIQLRKKRASSARRRQLENMSLTNGLLSESEKNPYRELSVLRREGDDEEAHHDVNLNQREKFNAPNPVISNMNSFTAMVTLEGNETEQNNGDLGVTGNPRFSPPPTYAEFLRASREELDRDGEEKAYFLPNMPNMGPSYR